MLKSIPVAQVLAVVRLITCWEKTVSESKPPYYGVILTVYAN
nr:hypothetical protein [Pectobacterium carotovorum]